MIRNNESITRKGETMSNKILSRFTFGDIELIYLTDSENHVGMSIIPSSVFDMADFENKQIESLVQLHIRGDGFPSGFAGGVTLSRSQSTQLLRLRSQETTGSGSEKTVVTYVEDGRGNTVKHLLTYQNGRRAFSVRCVYENNSGRPEVLENISSFSLGMLTPFGGVKDTDRLRIYRAKSWWSAEGRVESGTLLDYHLETSWSRFGVRSEKYGQLGSMPVRHYFPFAAVEDKTAGTVWAVQLACPSSWQMEFLRPGESLSLTGGLADYEYGHWCKTIAPGESFETPEAYLTAGAGSFDDVCQRLLDMHTFSDNIPGDGLPLVFNEYCTTWGNPTAENIRKITDVIKTRGFDYFVIDAGWYCEQDWGRIGDWDVSARRFPNGLKEAADIISDAGMKPGIWFELENCSGSSEAAKDPDMLLFRNGTPISTGRMFFDMKKEKVKDYLRGKVIDKLRDNGFGYIKIDYNDSIGIGCDDADSLGEGLRKSVAASQDFFNEIHEKVPGILIECCSSGGHRLEPSFMNICDMASFSDAHECVHIPIIAANLHRLIQPAKSQIWAVLRKTDSLRRINYSLVNTMLGVMCISGDVYDLSGEQWDVVDKNIAFYKKYSHVIKKGTSSFYGSRIESYLSPEGWQAVVRYNSDSGISLIAVHTFGGEIPEMVSLPVNGDTVLDVLSSEGNQISISGGRLNIQLKADFEAVAVAVK